MMAGDHVLSPAAHSQ